MPKKLFWHLPLMLFVALALNFSGALAQDATEDPTLEVTPEATPEVTEEPTQEPTTAPTEAPAPAATEEATIAPVPEGEGVTIDGSLTMAPLVNALIENYAADSGDATVFTVNTNGPVAAFQAFCGGTLDIAMSTRYIDDSTDITCQNAGIQYVENTIAYQALVVVYSPSLQDQVTCVGSPDLDTIFGLPADGQATTLQNLGLAIDEPEPTPLTVYSPAADTAAYGLLAALLPSTELRSDPTFYENIEELAELLGNEEAPGIAYLTLEEYNALPQETRDVLPVLQIRSNTTGACAAPSVETIESGRYTAVNQLMLYAALTSLEKPAVRGLLEYASGEGGQTVAQQTGATISTAAPTRNLNNLTTPVTGRTFSRPTTPQGVTPAAAGEIAIGGRALGFTVLQALNSSFGATYPGVILNQNLRGTTAAYADFCAGTVNFVLADRPATEEELAACTAAEIEPLDLPLGTDSIVFAVAAANADLPTCVTTAELVTAFAFPLVEASSTEIPNDEDREAPQGPTNWNSLNADYPDLSLEVFLPGRSSLEADWLFATAGEAGRYSRSDEEEGVLYDPAGQFNPGQWRATAVRNFEGGGLAILHWGDYQNSEVKDDLRLLEVNAGSGCVAPTEETLADGSYPLTSNLRLVLAQNALGQEPVAAYVWNALREETLTLLQTLNLSSFDVNALRTQRDQLFAQIEEARRLADEQAAAEALATAEATVEAVATSEATPEAAGTAEATAEATAETAATVEATAEATPEAE
jgi:phosphate transport system substrate-binding protein